MHSATITSPSRKGLTASKKAFWRVGRFLWIFVEDDVSVRIEDADVHGFGIQIGAAVEVVLFRVESHGAGSSLWLWSSQKIPGGPVSMGGPALVSIGSTLLPGTVCSRRSEFSGGGKVILGDRRKR